MLKADLKLYTFLYGKRSETLPSSMSNCWLKNRIPAKRFVSRRDTKRQNNSIRGIIFACPLLCAEQQKMRDCCQSFQAIPVTFQPLYSQPSINQKARTEHRNKKKQKDFLKRKWIHALDINRNCADTGTHMAMRGHIEIHLYLVTHKRVRVRVRVLLHPLSPHLMTL